MIDDVLNFLKGQLNIVIPPGSNGVQKVSYINLGTDPPGFQDGINMFMINLEEETQLRPPNRYVVIRQNGQKLPAQPPMRLHIIVLFAAQAPSAATYDEALKQLSNVLKFFQKNPVFKPEQYPQMAEKGLGELMIELNPLSYSQQNEIWSSMKRAYLPSVSFRVKMIIIQAEPLTLEGEIEEIDLRLKQ